MKPPQFLKPGDVVTLGIQGLGEQRQKVVAWSADPRRRPPRASYAKQPMSCDAGPSVHDNHQRIP